jgi:outer membrane biosynthesis protein TonB
MWQYEWQAGPSDRADDPQHLLQHRGGSVTLARIAKGTGAPVLDRRSSPWCAGPRHSGRRPDGQPKSFTVPLNFSLQQ